MVLSRYFLAVWLFACSAVSLYGQEMRGVPKQAMRIYEEAREAYRAKRYERALELLERVKGSVAGWSAPWLLEADVRHGLGDRRAERHAIEEAVRLDSLKGRPYYFLVLGDSWFDEGEYARAEECYRHYLRRDGRHRERVERQLANCHFALEALAGGVREEPELYREDSVNIYWPALDVRGGTFLFTRQEGEREELWMAKGKRQWRVWDGLPGNSGAPSLTADGGMMFFAMEGGRSGFDIYVAYRLTDTTWSAPLPLAGGVNTDGWEGQPSVSADGRRLFFASTREGGRGGSDVWYSQLLKRGTDGRQLWSTPKCLFFNTSSDEMAPFVYYDGHTLFFASDGYPGMGRKDIYRVDLEQPGEPVNVGLAVNTQGDEFGFSVDASGEWGYFSSDVAGRRRIYRCRLGVEVAPAPASYVSVEVRNEAGVRVMPEELLVADADRQDTLAWYDAAYGGGAEGMLVCVPAGRLLRIGVVKRGFLYYSDTLRTESSTLEKPQRYTARLQRVEKGREVVLKGVRFDVDSDRLREESYAELLQLAAFLRLNPSVRVEIAGHTDDTGGKEHNAVLSENRAFEVYKFLVQHRIPKERMEYRGYGASRPVGSNATEEGRAMNRRTEVRVLDI